MVFGKFIDGSKNLSLFPPPPSSSFLHFVEHLVTKICTEKSLQGFSGPSAKNYSTTNTNMQYMYAHNKICGQLEANLGVHLFIITSPNKHHLSSRTHTRSHAHVRAQEATPTHGCKKPHPHEVMPQAQVNGPRLSTRATSTTTMQAWSVIWPESLCKTSTTHIKQTH